MEILIIIKRIAGHSRIVSKPVIDVFTIKKMHDLFVGQWIIRILLRNTKKVACARKVVSSQAIHSLHIRVVQVDVRETWLVRCVRKVCRRRCCM